MFPERRDAHSGRRGVPERRAELQGTLPSLGARPPRRPGRWIVFTGFPRRFQVRDELFKYHGYLKILAWH